MTKRFYSCCRAAATVGLLPLLLTGIAGPSHAQQAFSSPEAAAAGFIDALATNDAAARAITRFDPGTGWVKVAP
jgi:hypothetical protein